MADQLKKLKNPRENHSEIERRRRIKMSTCINELSNLIPKCRELKRKPDKLTTLRMAVMHMKSLYGSGNTENTETFKSPIFLNDRELSYLIYEAANGFLIIISCDGKIYYVTDTIAGSLGYSRENLIGDNIYKFLHPDDIDYFRQQLILNDKDQKTRILELRTGTIKRDSIMKSENRTKFKARLKICSDFHDNRPSRSNKQNIFGPSQDNINYAVVNFSGIIEKNLPFPVTDTMNNDYLNLNSSTSNNKLLSNCLVLTGTIDESAKPDTSDLFDMSYSKFSLKLDHNGVVTFVDQRFYSVTGYNNLEILEQPLTNFFYEQDHLAIQTNINELCNGIQNSIWVVYRFKMKQETYVWMHLKLTLFSNPCTFNFECILCDCICTGSVMTKSEIEYANQSASQHFFPEKSYTS